MAHLNGVFFSKCLAKPVHYTAVLCNDNTWGVENNPHYKRPTKSVYLLHGYSGCDQDWFTNVPLGDLANRFNVNFFMPCGDNSFYLDGEATGFSYAHFTGEEFIEYTRKTFNLSRNREDTFIGGLSMGGFGALHTALMFPENFSKVLALSSALLQNGLGMMKPGFSNGIANYEYYRQIFGDLDKMAESDNNPDVLLKKLVEAKAQIPEIYLAVGTEDFLLNPNKAFKELCDSLNVPVTFFTGPGVHDFVFWRAQLVAALEWALGK